MCSWLTNVHDTPQRWPATFVLFASWKFWLEYSFALLNNRDEWQQEAISHSHRFFAAWQWLMFSPFALFLDFLIVMIDRSWLSRNLTNLIQFSFYRIQKWRECYGQVIVTPYSLEGREYLLLTFSASPRVILLFDFLLQDVTCFNVFLVGMHDSGGTTCFQ